MRILIVANEEQVIQNLESVLKGFDASIEVISSTDHLLGNFDQFVQEKSPNLVLINQGETAKKESDILRDGKFKTTVTVATESEAYTFEAYQVNNRHYVQPGGEIAVLEHEIKMPSGQVHFAMVAGDNLKEAEQKPQNSIQKYRQRFLVKQGQRFHSVPVEEIAYFYSEDRFIFLKTVENMKYLFEYRIEELERMLDPNMFFRVNRAFFISIKSIDQVQVYPGNRLKLQLLPASEREIIVSRERVPDFRRWLGE